MVLMFRKSLEKRLLEISRRIKKEKEDLLVAEEQLISLIDDADEARIRSLVSETAISDNDRRDSARQSENMEKYCQNCGYNCHCNEKCEKDYGEKEKKW